MKPILSTEHAKRAANCAIELSRRRGLKVAIAIVDDGGRLLYFERMDDVPWGSGDVALEKAVSAAAYRRSTQVFDKRLTDGRMAVLGQPYAFAIQGGVPLFNQGVCVGAIGASGALASEDAELCEASARSYEQEIQSA
jgi:glc operon protein GlcG